MVPFSGSGHTSGLQFDACGRYGHVEAYCYRKKKGYSCRVGHSSHGTGGVVAADSGSSLGISEK